MTDSTRYICSKMFTDLNINFPNESVKNCCKSNNTKTGIHEIQDNNIDPFLQNTDYLSRKAEMLFLNRLPEHGCATCTKTEPNSLFRTWNNWLSEPDSEFDDAKKLDLYDNNYLRYYEVVLNSTCDLKCVYCGSHDSSSWALELKEPKREARDEWRAATVYRFLEHIKNKKFDPNLDYDFVFSGGEPTYNLETIEFIKDIVELTDGANVRISINTNMNAKPVIFDKFMDLIDSYPDTKFVIHFSVEDIEERAEAVRTGLNWERAMSNYRNALTRDNAYVVFMPTPNMYSLPSTLEYVKFFVNEMKAHNKFIEEGTRMGKSVVYSMFSHNMVQETPLSPMSMPVKYKSYLTEAIDWCYNNGVSHFAEHLENVRNLIGTRIDEGTAEKVESKFNYFKRMRPEHNWDELFPHVNEIITELKNNDTD